MDPNNLPNVSDKAQNQGSVPKPAGRPKLNKIVSGSVVPRKKPLGSKIRETFTGDDARTVGNFVLMDVILPSLRDLLYEIVMQSLGRSLYGNVGRKAVQRFANGPGQINPGFISYNLMGQQQHSPAPGLRAMQPDGPNRPLGIVAGREFEEVVFSERGDADAVLTQLATVLNDYRVVTLSEYKELIGVPFVHTDLKWGWFSLQGAGVKPIPGGYVLVLPRPVQIDN